MLVGVSEVFFRTHAAGRDQYDQAAQGGADGIDRVVGSRSWIYGELGHRQGIGMVRKIVVCHPPEGG